MNPAPILKINTRQQWRNWLKRNHAQSTGVWLQLYKKHLNPPLTYPAAVEEALCFGWIDGQLRRIDNDRHRLRFSPRRPNSIWAPSNIARVKKLIRAKKMTPAGLRVYRVKQSQRRVAPVAATPGSLTMPLDLKQAVQRKPIAWKHWQSYPPSFRRMAIVWVRHAKQPETRLRRIQNIVHNAAINPKPQY